VLLINIPIPRKAIALVPPAKPSTPSVKLVALLSATITKEARNQKKKPRGRIILKGRVTLVISGG